MEHDRIQFVGVTPLNPESLRLLPSRQEVEARLWALIDGRCTREQAADWAAHWILADQMHGVEVQVNDFGVWDALGALMGADSKTIDRSYLYDASDFQRWIEELHRAPRHQRQPGP